MAISNYSELLAAVDAWMARTDLASGRAADFVTLAEARLNRELRVREMVATATGSIADAALAVPSGFIEVVRLTLDTAADYPLEYRPIEDAETRVGGVTSGQPRWYSVEGSNFKFYPAPDGSYDYTLVYYAKITALSSSSTTNWLLTKAPDVYLFGALAESAPFLMDDARVGYWESRFRAAIDSMHGAEARSKRTSGPLRARVLV